MYAKILKLTICLFVLSVSTSSQTQCNLLANILKEYSINNSSSAFLNSIYQKHCSESGYIESSSGGFGLDVILGEIPIGLKGNSSSSKTRIDNFCKEYRSQYQATSSSASYDERISSRALETIDRCLEIERRGATVKGTMASFRSVSFYMHSGPATELVLQGVRAIPENGLSCQGIVGGKLIPFNLATTLRVVSPLSFSCERIPTLKGGTSLLYDEQVIEVQTNLGPFNMVMPKDEKLSPDTANQINARLDAMENRLRSVASSVDGIGAGECSWSNWQNKEPIFPNTTMNACPTGQFLSAIDFGHDHGAFWYHEKVRYKCCALKGKVR